MRRPVIRAPLPATLLCPGEESRPELWRGLHLALRDRIRTAFLLRDAREWKQGAPAGPETIFLPRFPFLADIAIASARAVVSGSPEVSRLACEAGVPVVEVGEGAVATGELADRLELMLDDKPRPRTRRRAGKQPLRFAVVADREYVPFLFGLLENLREVHAGPREVTLLALDDETAREAARFCDEETLAIVRPRDLWNEAEWRRVARRDRAVQAYSSKPRLLKHALAAAGGAPVFYFDLDLYFFRSPARLARELGRSNVLLFPHLNRSLSHSRIFGLYNAGMLGVAPGAERFLDWWADLCLHKCAKDTAAGFYDDQGFLDLAPVYFEDVKIYRGHDEDVAFWNFATLGVKTPVGEPWAPTLGSGKPVGSLHAAEPDELGLFELKAGWDQIVALHSGAPLTESLAMNVLHAQKVHYRELKTVFAAHHTLHGRLGLRPLPPLTARGARFFVDGRGRHILGAAAVMYRACRTGKRLLAPPASASPSFWIALQQRALFSDD